MLTSDPHKLEDFMPDDRARYEQRQIVKEALKEWLDDKFLTFGKWSAGALAAAGLAAIVYFICWKEFHT